MKNHTRIVIILDRSGSMATVRENTVKGFNDFISKQKEVKGDASVKLVQFDDKYDVVFDKPLQDTPELTQDTFVPRGGTALLDAQGRTIVELGRELEALSESERPNKVIIVTLTDGHENSSTDYTREKVKQLTEHQRTTYGWEFVFLGANQDAIRTAAGLGILRQSALTYSTADPIAYASAMNAMSANIASSRSLGKAINFTEEERNSSLSSLVGGRK